MADLHALLGQLTQSDFASMPPEALAALGRMGPPERLAELVADGALRSRRRPLREGPSFAYELPASACASMTSAARRVLARVLWERDFRWLPEHGDISMLQLHVGHASPLRGADAPQPCLHLGADGVLTYMCGSAGAVRACQVAAIEFPTEPGEDRHIGVRVRGQVAVASVQEARQGQGHGKRRRRSKCT